MSRKTRILFSFPVVKVERALRARLVNTRRSARSTTDIKGKACERLLVAVSCKSTRGPCIPLQT